MSNSYEKEVLPAESPIEQSENQQYFRSLLDDLNNPDLFNENKAGEYQYTQSEFGKTAFGSLELNDGQRDASAQKKVGGLARTERDDGGHFIGARFNGSSGEENLEAQDRHVNRGEFKRIENEWASHLEAGNKVFVNLESHRPNLSERPNAFMGYYIIEYPDGSREWNTFSLQNEDPAEKIEHLREIAEMDTSDYDAIPNAMEYPEDYNPADYKDIYAKRNKPKKSGEGVNSESEAKDKNDERGLDGETKDQSNEKKRAENKDKSEDKSEDKDNAENTENSEGKNMPVTPEQGSGESGKEKSQGEGVSDGKSAPPNGNEKFGQGNNHQTAAQDYDPYYGYGY